MATKRSAPSDLDSPPAQVKQARLQTQTPTFTRPTSLTSVQSLPGLSSPQLTVLSVSHIGHHPQQVGSLTTGISPSVTRRPLNLGSIALSNQPVMVAPMHTGTPSVLPSPFSTRMNLPGTPDVPVFHPGLGINGPRNTAAQLLGSPAPPYTSLPLPPYTIPIATVPLSESEVDNAENFCLSPSQFLYHPTSLETTPISTSSVAAAATVMSTRVMASNAENYSDRQSVCASTPTSRERATPTLNNKRNQVLKSSKGKLATLKLKHELLLKEKFFLEGGGNMMEFVLWKKKVNIIRDQYLLQHSLDTGEGDNGDHLLSPKDMHQTVPSITSNMAPEEMLTDNTTSLKPPSPGEPNTLVTFKMPQVTPQVSSSSSSTTIHIPLSTVSSCLSAASPKPSPVSLCLPAASPKPTPVSPVKSTLGFLTPSPRPAIRSQSSFSSVYESSHEDIVMRARHEADVKKAIAELRKEGVWSSCRLPKVVEPVRKKSHWDYLLEEMQWLATDFVNEKRWKINAAKKVNLCVSTLRSYSLTGNAMFVFVGMCSCRVHAYTLLF